MTARYTCLFGGSFNPPHVGHVLATAWALSTQPCDAVWWLPTYQHAFGKELLDFEARRQLCVAAVEPFGSKAIVSEIEREMGGVSWTIDTLRALRARYPARRFALLVGADILAQKDDWKRWDEIERTTRIFVIGRSGARGNGTGIAPVELPAISSTELRDALSTGELGWCRSRMPARCLEMIESNGWYRDGEADDVG